MDDSLTDQRIEQLEQRVAYLESEVGTNYEEAKFERRLEYAFPDTASVEFVDGRYGQFARVTDIDGDDVHAALERLKKTDYGHEVTETAEGLGIEVWTDEI